MYVILAYVRYACSVNELKHMLRIFSYAYKPVRMSAVCTARRRSERTYLMNCLNIMVLLTYLGIIHTGNGCVTALIRKVEFIRLEEKHSLALCVVCTGAHLKDKCTI